MPEFDVAVVGGGIIGVATARRLAESGARVVVVEKEDRVAAHQSSRNSGVLHTGIYYAPGSAKAENCRRGFALMNAYCDARGVPTRRCGKVIVAVDESELPGLAEIERRGRANGVRVERLDEAGLRDVEPNAAGVAALHVPEAGITDYRAVAQSLAAEFEAAGGQLRFGARVVGFERSHDEWTVSFEGGEAVTAARVINCAGLYSDRVAAFAGADPDLRIVPFRGEYYGSSAEAAGVVNGLVYPVPDPSFPFLGVHVTPTVHGEIECGPNAVFALSREGYRWRDVDARELWSSLAWPGTRRLMARHWRAGAGEMWRSLSRASFARAVRRLVPAIRPEWLRPAPAGVRAQALRRDGSMVDDFVFIADRGMVHVCNAPSPAATSSLAIAERVCAELERAT